MSKFGPTHPSRVILFDLDGTLIKHGSEPYQWTGGGVAQWQALCASIRQSDAEIGTYTAFGIATFKPALGSDGLPGDVISDMALGIGTKNPSLKAYIDPELVYFTGFKSKVDYALAPVHQKFDYLSKSDIWIIDDEFYTVIDPVRKAGYTAFHAQLEQGDAQEQIQACNALFDEIFNMAKEGCTAMAADEESMGPSFATPYHPGFDRQFSKIEPVDFQAGNTDTPERKTNGLCVYL